MLTSQAHQLYRDLVELDHFSPSRALEVAEFVEQMLTKSSGDKKASPN